MRPSPPPAKKTSLADAGARPRPSQQFVRPVQSRQIDFPLLARKRDLSSTATLVLLHAGDAMVLGLIHLDFAIAGLDREALLIAENA